MRISDWSSDVCFSDLGPSAADFLNTADESMIADAIFALGEEPKARRIARAIVHARPIERTGQLADIVRKATGPRPGEPEDPATRTFHAIDRQSVVSGKGVSVRVDIGVRRIITKK